MCISNFVFYGENDDLFKIVEMNIIDGFLIIFNSYVKIGENFYLE